MVDVPSRAERLQLVASGLAGRVVGSTAQILMVAAADEPERMVVTWEVRGVRRVDDVGLMGVTDAELDDVEGIAELVTAELIERADTGRLSS